jgi:hypothetical protein
MIVGSTLVKYFSAGVHVPSVQLQRKSDSFRAATLSVRKNRILVKLIIYIAIQLLSLFFVKILNVIYTNQNKHYSITNEK